jgi:hypothetical protein
MLFIFRQLRRLELRKRSGQYFLYAFGEIVLIVVGILIALQIGEWNQARRNQVEESSILLRLKTEFEENQQRLEAIQADYKLNSDTMRSFLSMLGPEPEPVADEVIHRSMAMLYLVAYYRPNSRVLNSLISSGKISLIRNEELNNRLNDWPSAMEDYQFWVDTARTNIELTFTGLREHHQFRDSRIDVSEWFESTLPEGETAETGPSAFRYDQKRLLSHPDLENSIEFKRVNYDIVRINTKSLSSLQQEILDLIDQELSKR